MPKCGKEEKPIFLGAVPGMTVTVRHYFQAGERHDRDWLMGRVHCGGGAPNPKIHNLFQIADVDTGVIRWVNTDLVTHIIART